MNARKIREDLKKLPKGVAAYDMAYNDAMERISGQADDPRSCAEKVLGLILCAKRPLKTSELQHSLMVEPGDETLDQDNSIAIEEISSVCAGLVRIDRESDTMTLVHYTTQDYLQRHRSRWLPRTEETIARVCISYLMLGEFHAGPCQHLASAKPRNYLFPFASYAAAFAGNHVDLALLKTVPRYCNTLSAEVARWLQCSPAIRSMTELVVIKGRLDSRAYRALSSEGRSLGHPPGFTGVHWAATFDHVNILKFCISQSLDMDIRDNMGMSALAYAALEGNGEACSLLLASGKVDVNSADNAGITPLFHAISRSRLGAVRSLLASRQLNADHRDQRDRTALLEASIAGDKYVFRMLLRDGRFTPDAKDADGRTPLSHAAQRGFGAILVPLLLTIGVEVTGRDDTGRTPCAYAALCGHHKLVIFLSRAGSGDGKSIEFDETTLLQVAMACRNSPAALILISQGSAVVNSKNDDGKTPLHLAVKYRLEDVAHALIYNEADINAKDGSGRTPLSEAIIAAEGLWPMEECFQLLCDHGGCDINTTDDFGRSPLFYAVEYQRHEAVRALLATGKIEAVSDDVEDASTNPVISRMLARYRAGWDVFPLIPAWMFGDCEPAEWHNSERNADH